MNLSAATTGDGILVEFASAESASCHAWLLNEKTPATSTDSWGRQPRIFLPAGFFGGKTGSYDVTAHSRAFLINCRLFPVGLSWRSPPVSE